MVYCVTGLITAHPHIVKVMRYRTESKTHMLLYAGEGDSVNDELEEDLIGVQGKIQGIDKWQIWEESDRLDCGMMDKGRGGGY